MINTVQIAKESVFPAPANVLSVMALMRMEIAKNVQEDFTIQKVKTNVLPLVTLVIYKMRIIMNVSLVLTAKPAKLLLTTAQAVLMEPI